MALFKDTIDKKQLLLCFQVHQPRRIKKITAANEDESFLDEKLDKEIMVRIARECYLPTNALLQKLIEQYPQIKVTFSISGTALEQMEEYAPEALESFKKLAATGSVEFVAETYYHSLAFLMEGEEFEIQILEHAEKIVDHFGAHPSVFMNTNLIYNDEIGRRISMMGFHGIITEGSEQAYKDFCPHYLYEHRDENGLKILMRNRSLSDDIAFRIAFSDGALTAEKFITWLEAMPPNEKIVTLALDYGTFGEHHKPESGIFNFLEHLLLLLAIENSYTLATPTEIVNHYQANLPISIPDYVAVAGCELADWVGNEKQREAFAALIELEHPLKERNDPSTIRLWRYLQASDHFYYLSEKAYHNNHLSPYASQDEAHQQYMRAIEYLKTHISGELNKSAKINEYVETERRNIENTPVWALNIDSREGFHNQSST